MVAVRVDAGYDRELQWVLVRNHSEQTVDLSACDLRTDTSWSLAPKGMQLVAGSFELPPRAAALLVTSPYVELDRGVAVEWRNVYLALDETLQAQVHERDIDYIQLVGVDGSIISVIDDNEVKGCCCDGTGGSPVYYQSGVDGCPEPDCGIMQPDACWKPGECPGYQMEHCCDPVTHNCTL